MPSTKKDRGTLKQRKGYWTLRLVDERLDGTWGRVTHVIRQTTKRNLEREREQLVAVRDAKLLRRRLVKRDRVDVVKRSVEAARAEHPDPRWTELRDHYLREKGGYYTCFSGQVPFDKFFAALGNPRWSQVRLRDITEYRDQRREAGVSDVTIQHELAMLRAVQNLAIDLGSLDGAFRLHWSFKKLLDARSKPYTPWYPWEVELFVSHLPEWCGRVVTFGSLFGFRRRQVESMRWVKNLDVDKGIIRPIRQKDNEQIRLELRELPQALQDLIAEQVRWSTDQGFDVTDPDGFVFRRPANYPRAGVDLGDWRNHWDEAFKACKKERPDFGADRTDLSVACKPGRHFHGLRSLAVTTLASLGLSWQVISMLTGHKNPEMIDHYNRPGKDQFAEGMRKYDNHLRLVS